MRITKFVHSCLLVEAENRIALFDPGQFSWESGLFDIAAINKLDDIIITHEHYDHMFVPFLQALTVKFPEVRITTTVNAADQLKRANFIYATDQPSQGIEVFQAPHESLEPFAKAPQNIGVNYLNRLTNPGDSHSFSQTREILALPITAPWGSFSQAVRLAVQLKPKVIIPIHDWHWNPSARKQAYGQCEQFFSQHNIKFIQPQDGQMFEV